MKANTVFSVVHLKQGDGEMKCPHCGESVEISAKFCIHCGEKLSDKLFKDPASGEKKKQAGSDRRMTMNYLRQEMRRKRRILHYQIMQFL